MGYAGKALAVNPDALRTAGPAKLALARRLSSPSVGRAIGTLARHRIRNFGLTFDTSDPAISADVEARLFWRLYESSEIRLARRHLTTSTVVVDLGASLGFTGSHALAVMQPGGRYVGLEANRSLLPTLRRTLDQHAGGRSVEVVHGAISYDGTPTVRLATHTSNVASRVGETGQEVPAVTLTSLLEGLTLADGRFSMLCDIEGAEAGMILRDDALDQCEVLIIELHRTEYRGTAYGVADLHAALVDRGFRLLEQSGPVLALVRALG